MEPTSTVLAAELDQAGLHALLDRVRALGLELVDIKQVPARLVPDIGGPDIGTMSIGAPPDQAVLPRGRFLRPAAGLPAGRGDPPAEKISPDDDTIQMPAIKRA